MLAMTLFGVALLVMVVLEVSSWPSVDARWRLRADGELALVASPHPQLQAHAKQALHALRAASNAAPPLDAKVAAAASARWIVDDAERARQLAQQDLLGQWLSQPGLTLLIGDLQEPVYMPTRPRGWSGLGLAFWVLSLVSLCLYLAGAWVVLRKPSLGRLCFGILAWAQAATLLLIALENLPPLGHPPGLARLDWLLRAGLDLLSAAALPCAILLSPTGQRAKGQPPSRSASSTQRQGRQAAGANMFATAESAAGAFVPTMASAWARNRSARSSGWLACAILALATGLWVAIIFEVLPQAWWLLQAAMLASGAGSLALLGAAAESARPHTRLLRRLTGVGLMALAIMSLAMVAASLSPFAPAGLLNFAAAGWTLCLSAVFLAAPFVARSRRWAQELAVLAGLGMLALSLYVGLAWIVPSPGAALGLALTLAAVLYAVARPWLTARLVGSGGAAPSAEQMFDSLYRAARDIEHLPDLAQNHVLRLLRELFDPQHLEPLQRVLTRSRVSPDGSTLVVPMPLIPALMASSSYADPERSVTRSVMLRAAQRGTRLFTREDARLTDRVMEQLRHAIVFDGAVEHGRNEERARIAQDLHDDIGARLLTLMYKAQNPEIEEYLRHTLQDLKTLTRGLAASNHHLSHAAAEWKADITQRLLATHCDLTWSFTMDRDIPLSVVQWSALTRILRELVNNIIVHAHATAVEISAQCDRGRLLLTVTDDGIGRQPESWSPGLGLGGVRKRVRLLGGDVVWRERSGRGVRCEVRVPKLGEKS